MWRLACRYVYMTTTLGHKSDSPCKPIPWQDLRILQESGHPSVNLLIVYYIVLLMQIQMQTQRFKMFDRCHLFGRFCRRCRCMCSLKVLSGLRSMTDRIRFCVLKWTTGAAIRPTGTATRSTVACWSIPTATVKPGQPPTSRRRRRRSTRLCSVSPSRNPSLSKKKKVDDFSLSLLLFLWLTLKALHNFCSLSHFCLIICLTVLRFVWVLPFPPYLSSAFCLFLFSCLSRPSLPPFLSS